MAKTPGQNNNQGEGPPDLDELLSDLKNKIGRIFGKQETTKKRLSLAEAIRHPIQRAINFLLSPFY